jgi:uncharacterized membrane protein
MSVAQVVSIIALVVLIVVALSWFLPGTRNRTQRDAASRDDDRYWVLGALYNNPDDPNWLVPKRYVGGWTLNVGHPIGRLIMFSLVALVILLAVLAAAVPGFSTYGCHPSTGCHF